MNKDFIMQRGRTIIIITEILAFCLSLFSEKYTVPAVIFVISLLAGIITAVSQHLTLKQQSSTSHYCFKCKGITEHHADGRCTACDYNSKERVYITIASLIIAFVGFVIKFIPLSMASILFDWFHTKKKGSTITAAIMAVFIPAFTDTFFNKFFNEFYISVLGIPPRLRSAFLFFGIWLCSYQIYVFLKNRRQSERFCPKCKKISIHNKYGVCSQCNLDSMTSTAYRLYCFLLAALVSINITSIIDKVAAMTPLERYEEYGDGTSILSSGAFLGFFFNAIIIGSLLSSLYMYPAILARRKDHPSAKVIFWLNMFFGCTVIGWIVLLVWVNSNSNNSNGNMQSQNPTLQNNASQQPLEVEPKPDIEANFAELKRLHDMGMITDEEFEEKRKELVGRI